MLSLNDQGLGLYVHFPYCSQRCPYCDFTLTTAPIPHQAYLNAVLQELEGRLQELSLRGWDARPLTSLYFGGGTPGLWSPHSIHAFIERCDHLLGFKSDIEITMEANPAELTLAELHQWKSFGVNRLSLGAQSMREETLRRLGRDHNPQQVREAVDWSRLVGIERVNVDLMHGLKGDGVGEALHDLEEILHLSPSHISLYQLTVEEQTSFGARARRGEQIIEPEEGLISIYRAIDQRLSDADCPLYEVSNAAIEGEASRHNLLHWTMGEYLGIGTGAHGRVNLPSSDRRSAARALRWQNTRSPKQYLKLSEAQIKPNALEEERGELDEEGLDEEHVMVGLRLKSGLQVTESLALRYGERARQLEREGLLRVSETADPTPSIRPIDLRSTPRGLWWIPTQRGMELLDHVAYRLILG